MHRLGALFAVMVVAVAYATAIPASADPPDAVEVVATGLRTPWSLAFTPDGRVFVSERATGVVSELVDGAPRPVHELTVDDTGEGGLLGLAVSPEFSDDGVLYAYITTGGDNRIVRFRPGGEVQPVLTGIPSASNHNGGRIAFGPDGMLYAGTGDAGRGGLAQDKTSLAGKILRLTPDGDIPEDNPFNTYVWSVGHRNVQGLAWDAAGRLYASEFGPDRDDEVNRIVAGRNYGWPNVTGDAGDERYTDPVFVRQPGEASWSGATILTSGAIPEWDGDLLLAGLRGERLWRLDLDGDGDVAGAESLLVGDYGRLRLVTEAPDGSVWLTTSNRDGRGDPGPQDDRILRLAP